MKKILFIGIIISLFFTCFICLHIIGPFDNTIYNAIISIKTENVTNFFLVITNIIYLIFIVLILSWTFFKNKKIPFLITLNLICSYILDSILKVIFRRPRPSNINLVIEKGFSMPSAHAFISISFFGLIIYLIYKNYNKKICKKLIISILSMYILLIGITRIYLGVHYASDVLLGFSYGIIYLIFFIKIFDKYLVVDK